MEKKKNSALPLLAEPDRFLLEISI